MRSLAAPGVLPAIWLFAAVAWPAPPPEPTAPLPAEERGPSAEECSRLASYRTALLSVEVREAGKEALLRQLRRVPPVAWVEGYWATPVDLSVLAGEPGEAERDGDSSAPETVERQGLPPLGLAFTSGGLRATVAVPSVGDLAWLDSAAAAKQGVFVVPAPDPEEALIEYLPPPPPAAGEDSCYYFCGDPAAWDFDQDGAPNTSDSDDDDDGVPDRLDAYPYWPVASDCDCGGYAFVGFTQKFSPLVAKEVVTAYDSLGRESKQVALGGAGDGAPEVRFVFPDETVCASAAAECPGVEDSRVRYVSRNPDECSRIRFRCEADRVPFSDDCGCGCRPGQ